MPAELGQQRRRPSSRAGRCAATWASSASTHTPNGTSRSNSAAVPASDQVAALLGPVAHLGQQPGLADPRLALHGQARRRPSGEARPAPHRPASARRHGRPSVRADGHHVASLPRPQGRFQGFGSGGSARCSGGASRAGLPHAVHLDARRRHARAAKHRSTGRPLERPAPQDRHHRLDHVRGPGLHGRRQGRHRSRSSRTRRASATRARPRRSCPGRSPTSTRSRCSSRARASGTDSPEFHAVVSDVEKRLEATKGVKAAPRSLRPEGSVGRSPATGTRCWSASRSRVTPRTTRWSTRWTRPWPRPQPPRSRTATSPSSSSAPAAPRSSSWRSSTRTSPRRPSGRCRSR